MRACAAAKVAPDVFKVPAYSEGTIFKFVLLCYIRFCFIRESDLAIHILGANNPRDVFHVFPGWNSFVLIVSALAHFEGHKSRWPQESTEDDFFALREATLDVRPVARVAQRLGCLRLSASNDDTHTFPSNQRSGRSCLCLLTISRGISDEGI
jgi:hypothetical protein